MRAQQSGQASELLNVSDPSSLNRHQVRVLQFALRDVGCYDGPRSGVLNAATRNALRCAQERTGASGQALARELALWRQEGGMTNSRQMGGDVELDNRRQGQQGQAQQGQMRQGQMQQGQQRGQMRQGQQQNQPQGQQRSPTGGPPGAPSPRDTTQRDTTRRDTTRTSRPPSPPPTF